MSDANYTKNCIAYYPIYTKITGSITCGILLSQIMYWYKKTKGKEFYKIDKELQEEIQLTDNEMRSAKKKLKDLGILIVIKKGMPAKSHYSIDENEIQKRSNKFSEIHVTSLVKFTNTVSLNSRNKLSEIHEATTEITTDINTSIATHSDSAESNEKNKRVRSHSPLATKIHKTPAARPSSNEDIKQLSTVAVGNLTAKQPFSRQVVEKFTADQLRLNLRMKSIAVTHEIDRTWIQVIFDNFTGWWAEEAKPKNKPLKSQAGWERAWTHWVSKAPKIYHSPQPGSKRTPEAIMDLTDYPDFLEFIKKPNTRYRRLVDHAGGIDHCMTNGFPEFCENPWEVILSYE